jgi:HSP20 family protein
MTTMQRAGLARGLPPHANVSEADGEYVIELELSDFAEPELSVELEHGIVTVRGEQRASNGDAPEPFRLRERLEESFSLPDDAESHGVEAYFERGVLEIHVPRHNELRRRIALQAKPHGLLHDGAEAV